MLLDRPFVGHISLGVAVNLYGNNTHIPQRADDPVHTLSCKRQPLRDLILRHTQGIVPVRDLDIQIFIFHGNLQISVHIFFIITYVYLFFNCVTFVFLFYKCIS